MGKRKFLSLDQRIEAIKLLETGFSSRNVAEKFGVGRSQIQVIRHDDSRNRKK